MVQGDFIASAALSSAALAYTLVAARACYRAHIHCVQAAHSAMERSLASRMRICLPDWGSSTAVCIVFAASLLLRAAWFVLRQIVPYDDFWGFFLFNANRTSMLLQFSALTLVVRQWAVALFPHKGALGRTRVNRTILALNFIVYAALLALQPNDGYYNDDMLVIASIAFLLPLTVLLVGIRLSRVLAAATQRSSFRRAALAKLRMCMATSLVMMGLRAALFTAHPLFHIETFSPPALDSVLYPWCFYVLPDVVPDLMFVSMLHRGARRRLARGAGTGSLALSLDSRGPAVEAVSRDTGPSSSTLDALPRPDSDWAPSTPYLLHSTVDLGPAAGFWRDDDSAGLSDDGDNDDDDDHSSLESL